MQLTTNVTTENLTARPLTAVRRLQGGTEPEPAPEQLLAFSIRGATVKEPRKARDGHKFSLRIDLPKPDSEKRSKYILSVADVRPPPSHPDPEPEPDATLHAPRAPRPLPLTAKPRCPRARTT